MASGWKITPRGHLRIYEVARMRDSVPTDDELAAELGLSKRAVQWHLKQERLRTLGAFLLPRRVTRRLSRVRVIPRGGSRDTRADDSQVCEETAEEVCHG